MYVEGQPENEFYNLIIHKSSNDDIRKPYIKKYTVFPDALDQFEANNYNFRYFKGTFNNFWLADFINMVNKDNKENFNKALSTCETDTGGTTGGSGGSTYNADLIDLNNDVTWTGTGQIGYTRPIGPWNNYGGTGGYDIEVDRPNEVAFASGLTSQGIEVFTGASIISVEVNGLTTYVRFSTSTGGSSGSGCAVIYKITEVDGNSTVTKIYDCGLEAQKSRHTTKAESSCPVDDGPVAVASTSTVFYIMKSLLLPTYSPEYIWLSGELTLSENEQVMKLERFLMENNTTEDKEFGLEALRAMMDGYFVDFEEEDKIDNQLDDPCASLIFNQLQLMSMNDDVPLTVSFDSINGLQSDLNFSRAILNIFNNSQDYKYITKEDSSMESHQTGITEGKAEWNTITSEYEITSRFNPDFFGKSTDLNMARTMIHESVHAFLVYTLRAEPFGGIKKAMEKYAQDNGWPNTMDNRLNHNFMAQFVDALAYNLYQWNQNFGSNRSLSWEYFHDMAWGGLANYPDRKDPSKVLFYQEFEAYLKTFDDPKTTSTDESLVVKTRILDTITAEATNSSNSSQNGDKNPCQ